MKFEIDELIKSLMEMDCGDSSCWFAQKKTGMRTNGGCRCLSGLPSHVKHHIVLLWQNYWKALS